jgi:hypothetical protein
MTNSECAMAGMVRIDASAPSVSRFEISMQPIEAKAHVSGPV